MFKNYMLTTTRSILRAKVYTFINVFGLALGMACCAVVGVFIFHELSYEKHHENAERIYKVLQKKKGADGDTFYSITTDGALSEALKSDYPEIESSVRTFVRPMWLGYEKESYQAQICITEPSFFDVFTYPLLEGKPEALRTPYTAFITQSVARRFFGQENPIGKVMRLDYKWDITGDFTVVGVLANMPKTTTIRTTFDFVTTTVPAGRFADHRWNTWVQDPTGLQPFNTFVLLREDADVGVLEQKMDQIVKPFFPAEEVVDFHYRLQNVRRIHLYSEVDFGISGTGPNDLGINQGDIANVYLCATIGLFILLVACVNFVNLATAQADRRAREVGVRKVVGAYRKNLMRQFLGESVLISALAMFLGLCMTELALPYVGGLLGIELSLSAVGLLWVVGGAVGLSVLVGVTAGIYPALILSAFDPARVLKSARTIDSGSAILRKGLVVFQYTTSVVLIVAVIVAHWQLDFMQNRDLGFDRDQVITLPIFRTDSELSERYQVVKQAFLQHPNVTHATASWLLPGQESGFDMYTYSSVATGQAVTMGVIYIEPDFLRTYGMTLVAGDIWSEHPPPSGQTHRPILLTQKAVDALGLTHPVGTRILSGDQFVVVSGVVKDFQNRSQHHPMGPVALVPAYNFSQLTLRLGAGNMHETMQFLQDMWKQFAPTRPFSFLFLDDLYQQFYERDLRLRSFYSLFSALAIFVSSLGLLGLISFTIERRTKEIGIRRVLGAKDGQIVSLLLNDFVWLIVVANVIAAPIAYFITTRWLEGFAYRIDLSVWMFVVAGAVTGVAALLTIGWQIMRATTIDPARALSSE